MAYNSLSRRNTPESLRTSGIISLLIGLVMLIASGVVYARGYMIKKACTETATGVVTNVSSTLKRSRRSSHYEYKAEVDFTTKDDKHHTVMSDYTRYHYYEGETVMVHYSKGMTNYYVDHDEPGSDALFMLIFAVIMGVVGVINFLRGRNG